MPAVAVDTNLLLLLIVGHTRSDFIANHKRLKAYTSCDFDQLALLLRDVDVILTTPNVLTEVSNLLVQGVREPLRSQLVERFALFVEVMEERFYPCRVATLDPCFTELGLADTTWLCMLGAGDVLLTDDTILSNQLQSRGVDVITILPTR